MTYLKQLDGYRGISILLVLGAHLLPLGPKRFEMNHAAALAGMSLFFALSGFLITKFLLEYPDVNAFCIRRALRIIPLAWLVMAILQPCIGTSLSDCLIRFGFLQNYLFTANAPEISHYWSLCVEIHFYIAVAIIVKIGGIKALRYCLPVMLVFVTALRIWSNVYDSVHTHLRIDEILSGACLALVLHSSLKYRAKVIFNSVPFFAILILWGLSCHSASQALNYCRPYLAAALIAHSILGKRLGFLESKALKYLASISFALYIIHGPLRWGPFASTDSIELYFVKRPLTILLTFILAHISTNYYESKFIAYGRYLTKKR